MRARLIVNPVSGTNRGPALIPEINARLRSMVDELDITLTCSVADIDRAATRAVEERCDAFFVAGGDGTLNAAVSALMRTGGSSLPAIGVIPLGTGNDFVKSLGLSEDPIAAVDRMLAQRLRPTDVGFVNGRPFVNVSAGGFVADVSHVLTEELKDAVGKAAFLLGGARVLRSSEPFIADVQPEGPDLTGADGWRGRQPLRMFAVCNAMTIGGGYPVAPAACLDDGLFDLFLVREMGVLEFITVLRKCSGGTHVDDPRVGRFRASSVRLAFDRPVRVNIDGEPFEAAACQYTIRRRLLKFYVGDPAPCFGFSS